MSTMARSSGRPRLESKIPHSFSVYFPPDQRFHIPLAQKLAKKYKIKSVGELLRLFLHKGLQDHGLLDEKGRSTVSGIGPEPKKLPTGRKKLMRGPKFQLGTRKG